MDLAVGLDSPGLFSECRLNFYKPRLTVLWVCGGGWVVREGAARYDAQKLIKLVQAEVGRGP